MVSDFRNLSRCGQGLGKVALPTRGVLTGSMTPNGCPIQNRFDTLADAPGGFGFIRPDRIEDGGDVRDFNF